MLRILMVILVLLFATVFAPPLLGQVPSHGVPGNSTSDMDAVACESAVCPQSCSPGYWFVSTRGCPLESCCHCRYAYHYSDPSGCLHSFDASAFLQSLSPNVPVCIVVHGSYVDMDTVQIDARHTDRWLRGAAPGRPLQLVYFTWPSEGPITGIPHVDVAILGRRAEQQGFHLAQLIHQLPAGLPVCLLGHSHGTRVVASALHLMGGGTVQDCCLGEIPRSHRRIRAVFAAAAIDHHWLTPGERYGRAVWPAEAVLNLRNRYDLPLSAYALRTPFARPALAQRGFTSRTLAPLGWQANKVAEVDVSHIIGGGHIWPRYYRRGEIAYCIWQYVFFPDVDFGYANSEAAAIGEPRDSE